MSLERTNYGLSNEHLFYDVSFVVYCEGKKNDGNTHDEMFWSKVLSYFGIKCVCKSRGSKNEIVPWRTGRYRVVSRMLFLPWIETIVTFMDFQLRTIE